MTGTELVHALLIQGSCGMSGFREVCAGREDLLELTTEAKDRVQGVLREMSSHEFMTHLERNTWLIDVVARNGDGNRLYWSDIAGRLPSEFREDITSTETLMDAVKLFVWLFHTRTFDQLEIILKPRPVPTGKTVTTSDPPTRRRTKPVRTASVVEMPLSNTRSLRKYSRSNKHRQDNPTLDIYLWEIGEVPLLNPEEEYDLSRRIKQGDESALQLMVRSNLRFVVSVAKQYQNQGLSLSDLINEGNIGLIKAAKRFDETRGFKFISYGVWWIRQAILQALAEQSRIVRIPLNRVGVLHKLGKRTGELEQALGREPTEDELAAAVGVDVTELQFTKNIATSHLSLDAPFSLSEDNSLLDTLEDEKQPPVDYTLYRESLRLEIEKALDTLTPREAEVINLYFGLSNDQAITLEEIGVRFNLTRERVRQIKEKAIKRLQHASRRRALESYKDMLF